MEEKISNIIPTIMEEMQSDGENDSDSLLAYYVACNVVERSAVNNVLIDLCGWSFETLLEKCGLTIRDDGEVGC